MKLEELRELDARGVMQTYARAPVAFTHGRGCTLWDEAGRAYLDLGSGIGVNCLGHADPAWVEAVAVQAGNVAHLSNLYYSEVSTTLAARLAALFGADSRVFLCNSGAEANEGAVKLARKYSFDRYGRGRDTIVTLEGSFHGRTVTTLSATGQASFHDYFFPFTPGFLHLAPGDLAAMDAALDGSVCAVMLECVQGEGGVLPLEPAYLQGVAALCKARDVLLIIDEVQTGIGRTGSLFCHTQFGVTPDVMTLAKGLGGGLPIGAVVAAAGAAGVLGPGSHGSTFGGNPVVCAAAHVVLDRVAAPGFLAQVAQKGQRLREGLAAIHRVKQVRGMGLMLGLDLAGLSAGEAVAGLLARGVVALTAKAALRLLPPLVITDGEMDRAIAAIKEMLEGTP